MKRFLFIVISFISISSAKADDIEIATESQLREFANSVNGGNTYAGVTVKLTADIDLNNVDWMPIGTLANPFQGTFDGQGHWVDNLKVNVSGSATGNVAGLSVVSVRVELCRVWVCAAATSISVPNHPII